MGFVLPLVLVAVGGVLVLTYRDYQPNAVGLAITTFGSVVVTTGLFLLVFTTFGVYGIMILVPVAIGLSMLIWKRIEHRPLLGLVLVLLVNGWSILILIVAVWGSTSGSDLSSATGLTSRGFGESLYAIAGLGTG